MQPLVLLALIRVWRVQANDGTRYALEPHDQIDISAWCIIIQLDSFMPLHFVPLISSLTMST